MTNEKATPQNQENDPTIEKEAVDETIERYEENADSAEAEAATEKELGEVERALEDEMMGIEDAS